MKVTSKFRRVERRVLGEVVIVGRQRQGLTGGAEESFSGAEPSQSIPGTPKTGIIARTGGTEVRLPAAMAYGDEITAAA